MLPRRPPADGDVAVDLAHVLECLRDLLLRLRMRPHPYFRRDGNDVSLDVPIRVSEAIKGARIEVPTLLFWLGARAISIASRGRSAA